MRAIIREKAGETPVSEQPLSSSFSFPRGSESVSDTLSFALHAVGSITCATLNALEIPLRLLNPLSGKTVGTGASHHLGHNPIKKRALIWPLLAAGYGGLPSDYKPNFSTTPAVAGAFDHSYQVAAAPSPAAMVKESPLFDRVRDVLSGYTIPEQMTKAEAASRFPELLNSELFEVSNLGCQRRLKDTLSRRLIEECILDLEHNRLTEAEALALEPRLSGSGLFVRSVQIVKAEGDATGSLSLGTLRECVETIHAFPLAELGIPAAEAERMVAEAVKDSAMLESLRRKRHIGPYVDKLLYASADYIRQESIRGDPDGSTLTTSGLLSHLSSAIVDDIPPEYRSVFQERMAALENQVAVEGLEGREKPKLFPKEL